jgi:hypothetical protein
VAEDQVAENQYEISWAKAIVIGVLFTAVVLAFGIGIDLFAQAVGFEERGG